MWLDVRKVKHCLTSQPERQWNTLVRQTLPELVRGTAEYVRKQRLARAGARCQHAVACSLSLPPPHHPPHQTPLLKRRPIGQSIGASAPRGKGYTVVGAAGWRAAPPCKALSREGTAVGTQQKGGALRTRTNGASINASDRVPTTAAAPPDRRRDGQYCSPPPHPHSHLSNRGFSPGYPGTDGQPTADCKPHLP